MRILILSLLICATAFGQTRGTVTQGTSCNSGTCGTLLTIPATGTFAMAGGGTAVVCARTSTSANISSITDLALPSSTVFTLVGAAPVDSKLIWMWVANNTTAVASDTISIVFTAGGVGYAGAGAVQYSGTATSAVDFSVGSAGGSGPTTGTFSTAQALEVVVGCAASLAGESVTGPGVITTSPNTDFGTALSQANNSSIYMEDANLYSQVSGVTASIAGPATYSAIIAVGLMNSNPASPPVLIQTFSNATGYVGANPFIYDGSTATLTFAISNPGSSTGLTGVAFTDTLPSGMIVATPNGESGTCGGGTITATAGGTQIVLAGASLSALASCTFSVNVYGSGVVTTANSVTPTATGGLTGTTSVALLNIWASAPVTFTNVQVLSGDTTATGTRVIGGVAQNATSTSACTIGYSCSQLTVGTGLTGLYSGKSVVLNGCVTAPCSSTYGSNYMIATVSSYSGGVVYFTGSSGSYASYAYGSGSYSNWTINQNAFVALEYGTTNGGPYPYRVWTGLTVNTSSSVSIPTNGSFAEDITSLDPNTKYYGQVVAWQDEGPSYFNAPTSAYPASVYPFSFTTLNLPVPSFPTPPSPTWPNAGGTPNVSLIPPQPNTTNYTTIPMVVNGSGNWVTASGGPFVHAANARCTGDPGWSIASGVSFSTMLAGIGGYGAIIELTQGGVGDVPAGTDYNLPTLAIDPCATGGLISAPNHGWNIIQTHQNYASDFPPFPATNALPFRTGPNWASTLGTIQAAFPTAYTANSFGTGGLGSCQILATQSTSPSLPDHHWLVRNINLAHLANPTTTSSTMVTAIPAAGSGNLVFTVPAGLSIPASGVPYQAIATFASLVGTVASYSSITLSINVTSCPVPGSAGGSYTSWTFLTPTGNFQSQTAYTCSGPQSGVSFTVPAGFTLTPGEAITGFGSQGPLAAWPYMVSGPATYSGTSLTINVTFAANAGQGPFSSWTLVPAAYGPSICLGNGESGVDDEQNPPSYIVYDRVLTTLPIESLTNQQFSWAAVSGNVGANVAFIGDYFVGYAGPEYPIYQLGHGFYFQDCSPGSLTIANIEVSAGGQPIYTESNGSTFCKNNPSEIQNLLIKRSTVYLPPAYYSPSNALDASFGLQWDGIWHGSFRNGIEFKTAQYALVDGNWIDGAVSGQNSGAVFEMFGVLNPTQNAGSGLHDIEVRYTYAKHAASFVEVGGSSLLGCCGYVPESAPSYNFYFHDNYITPFGRGPYTQFLTNVGIVSWNFSGPAVQSLQIINNTLGYNNALYNYVPYMMGFGNAGPNMNGFIYKGNIAFFSQGAGGTSEAGLEAQTSGSSYNCNNGSTFPYCPNYPITPQINLSSVNYTNYFNTGMVGVGATLSETGTWQHNVTICGTDGTSGWSDMSQATCNSSTSTMPNLALDSYPMGSTMAARITAAGLPNYNNNNFRLSAGAANFGGSSGANINGLEAALGLTTNTSIAIGSTAVTFTWAAPDSDQCSVDVVPGSNPWVFGAARLRFTSASVGRNQTVTATGLSASTQYSAALMCSFSQMSASGPDRPWFGTGFPAEASSQQTEWTFTTAASASPRTALTAFSLPSGAQQAVVSFAPVSGSTVTNTCSTSPCSISLTAPGAYTQTVQFQTSGDVNVGLANTGVVVIP